MHAVTGFVPDIYFDTVTLRTLLKWVRFGLRPGTGMVLTGLGAVVKNLTHRLPVLYPTDSSTLTLLAIGSSSDCHSSESETGGLGECCNGLIALPLLAAAPTLESWLSTVAMNELKAASDLALSSPSTLVSLDWISTYMTTLEISPFQYPSTRALHSTRTS